MHANCAVTAESSLHQSKLESQWIVSALPPRASGRVIVRGVHCLRRAARSTQRARQPRAVADDAAREIRQSRSIAPACWPSLGRAAVDRLRVAARVAGSVGAKRPGPAVVGAVLQRPAQPRRRSVRHRRPSRPSGKPTDRLSSCATEVDSGAHARLLPTAESPAIGVIRPDRPVRNRPTTAVDRG